MIGILNSRTIQNPKSYGRLLFEDGRAIRTSTFQLFVTLAVVTTALLDPFQATIGVGAFVGIVLVKAGVHAGFAGGFVRVLRRHGRWEDRIPRNSRRSGRRGGGCRRSFR